MRPDDTVRIPLRARDGSVRAYALVDAVDAEWVNQWRWHLSRRYVARAAATVDGKRGRILLHRELLGLIPGDGLEGDHINRDRTDARRSNLRIVTKVQNTQNVPSNKGASSQYRGVCFDKKALKWRAATKANGRCIFLGFFTDEHEAGEAARAGRARLLPFSVD